MAHTSRHSRKGNRKHKSRRVHRSRHVRRTLYRTTRRQTRGGALSGSPLSDSLAGNWSSKMSMGQGGDYLKYHVGQHGGYLSGAPLSEVSSSGLPAELRGPAHVAGLDSAIRATAGMKDQAGGRRSRSKKSKKSKKSKRSKRSRRSKGGALGYAPTSAPGMLLNAGGYQQAGLSPALRANVEFDAAAARASL